METSPRSSLDNGSHIINAPRRISGSIGAQKENGPSHRWGIELTEDGSFDPGRLPAWSKPPRQGSRPSPGPGENKPAQEPPTQESSLWIRVRLLDLGIEIEPSFRFESGPFQEVRGIRKSVLPAEFP